MRGRIETGNTMKARRARNQSFRKATMMRAIRVVASFIMEADDCVNASRTRVVSLVTRDWIVPVGVRWKKDSDNDCKCEFKALRKSSTMRWPTYSMRYSL